MSDAPEQPKTMIATSGYPPASGQPAPLVVISTLVLDLAALVLIALFAHWHTFDQAVTAGAFFAVISGQVAAKARSGARGIGGLPGAGIVLGLVAGAHAILYGRGGPSA